MEARTLQLLEFQKILAALSGYAVSTPGAGACLELSPLANLDEVCIARAVVDQALEWARETGFSLSAFSDLQGFFAYLEQPANVSDAEGLAELRSVLVQAREAQEAVAPFANRGFNELVEACSCGRWPEKTWSGLVRCLDPDGRLKDESSPELLEVRLEIRSIHQKCTKKVKDYILGESNLGRYLQDEFMTISSDRYVLPLKSNFKGRLSGIIHDYSQTGETCYFEPMFLVELNNKLQERKREERVQERKVLEYLTGLVRSELDVLRRLYQGLVNLDVVMAKVRLAADLGAFSLDIGPDRPLRLQNARHPLLVLGKGQVEPFDIETRSDQGGLVISGGNAGGKTVCLKTLGLCALMALSGMPVPAAEGSSLPLFRSIFVVMGDEQSIEAHVSTFSAQIRYFARVWDEVDNGTLFLLDEFGAGTDPAQGAALAQAAVESLLKRGATVVCATHFPALKAFAVATEGVRAASVLFDPSTKKPLYKLAYDQVGASIALDVAREHGLPADILKRAESLLLLDGSDTTSVLSRLNELAVDRARELEALESERVKLEGKRTKLEERYEMEKGKVLDEIRRKAQDVVREWKRGKVGQKKARQELAAARERLGPARKADAQPRVHALDDLTEGMEVGYPAWGKTGIVKEKDERKGLAKVDMQGLAMWLKPDKLTPVEGGGGQKDARGLEAPSAGPTLKVDLRGLRSDEAAASLESFLDSAILKGAARVEVIHGKGTGALRREVREVLMRFPAVERFEVADEEHGGDGMTVVELA